MLQDAWSQDRGHTAPASPAWPQDSSLPQYRGARRKFGTSCYTQQVSVNSFWPQFLVAIVGFFLVQTKASSQKSFIPFLWKSQAQQIKPLDQLLSVCYPVKAARIAHLYMVRSAPVPPRFLHRDLSLFHLHFGSVWVTKANPVSGE